MERPGGKPDFSPTPEQRARIDGVMKKLEHGLDAIYDDATFKAWLDVQSRFHNYSWRNSLLIMAQRPEASQVMGLRQWNRLQRFVNKGEQGLDIFAPIFPPGLSKEQQKHAEPSAFIPVKVFDVSQTNGKPLPEFDVPVLEGDEGGELYGSLGMLAINEGVAVHELDRSPDGSMGFYSPLAKIIGICTHDEQGQEISQLQRTKTMAHEVAHHFDIGDRAKTPDAPPRDRAETEGIAEASAYVVLAHFGLDSGVRSFPYIAHWTKDKRTLKGIMAEIQRVSGRIIRGCEEMLGVGTEPGHAGDMPSAEVTSAPAAAVREDVLRPYRVIHSNVDGAGTIGEFDTLEQAKEEADRLQAKATADGDAHGYRFHVFDRRSDKRHQT
jgi:N-terminal domain of anti-restriction factor ArdC